MTKKELFDIIVDTTAEVCDISASSILGRNNHAEVVDARCIVIERCRHYGLTNRDIMQAMCRPNTTTIRSLAATYDARCRSFSFRIFATEIRQRLSIVFDDKMP